MWCCWKKQPQVPLFENIESNQHYSVGIVLAAGASSRFDSIVPKQLHRIGEKYMFEYSLDAMSVVVDEIVIVTNSDCYCVIEEMTQYCKIPLSICINNKYDNRLLSIHSGLAHVQEYIYPRMKHYRIHTVIHDVARPFVTSEMFERLLESNRRDKFIYSQYCMKLKNGLIHVNKYSNETIFDFVDRKHYIEACTPLCIDFEVAYTICMDYMAYNKVHEFLPIINKWDLPVHFIEESYNTLCKITTIDDLY
jgi:2-C-methyl-D-erythritol 4-phosphate cytidylyltransferase